MNLAQQYRDHRAALGNHGVFRHDEREFAHRGWQATKRPYDLGHDYFCGRSVVQRLVDRQDEPVKVAGQLVHARDRSGGHIRNWNQFVKNRLGLRHLRDPLIDEGQSCINDITFHARKTCRQTYSTFRSLPYSTFAICSRTAPLLSIRKSNVYGGVLSPAVAQPSEQPRTGRSLHQRAFLPRVLAGRPTIFVSVRS